jgi:hypothetical protein
MDQAGIIVYPIDLTWFCIFSASAFYARPLLPTGGKKAKEESFILLIFGRISSCFHSFFVSFTRQAEYGRKNGEGNVKVFLKRRHCQ